MNETRDLVNTDPAAQVHAWIVEGQTEDQINQAIAQIWPDQKARPLIIAAMKRIAAAAEVNRDSVIGWCFEATRLVYRRSIEKGDHGAALRAIRQLLELADGQIPKA